MNHLVESRFGYFFMFSVLLTIIGCSKYDEGCATTTSKSKRLCQEWQIEFFKSENDPNRHGMSFDVEHFSGDESAPVPYEIWYPSSGGWFSYGPQYTGCPETTPGVPNWIPVDSLTFSVSNCIFNFSKDGSFNVSYDYNNREFDIVATSSDCNEAIYKYVSGSEQINGKWAFSDDKTELKLTLNNSATHFPLLDHCLRSKIYIKQLCKDELKFEFGYTYTKNPNGLFPSGPHGFVMKLKH